MRFVLLLAITIAAVFAQTPPAQPPGTPSTPVRPRALGSAFPQPAPADPAAVERGKTLYGLNCGFCHGSDGRGGEGGPVLLRSQLVLNDRHGETIAPIVLNGRDAMPKFDLTQKQIADIAAFIHSFKVGGYDISRMTPPSIVVGDPKAGEAYFNSTCRSCHSVTGDLKSIAARISDAKQLQQTWLMPGARGGFGPSSGPKVNVPPTTVTVTLASGQKVEGRLNRIDDFFVTLTDSDGAQHTYTREGDIPKVEIHDPLEPHRSLLRTYSDKDIHNLTAYLVTLK